MDLAALKRAAAQADSATTRILAIVRRHGRAGVLEGAENFESVATTADDAQAALKLAVRYAEDGDDDRAAAEVALAQREWQAGNATIRQASRMDGFPRAITSAWSALTRAISDAREAV